MKPSDSILKKAAEYLKQPFKLKHLVDEAFKKAPKVSEVSSAGQRSGVRQDLQTLIELTKAYYKGQYRRIPWKSITMVVGALIYFVSIIDLVPDFILGVGLLDDISVILWTMKHIRNDLEEFRKWQDLQNSNPAKKTNSRD